MSDDAILIKTVCQSVTGNNGIVQSLLICSDGRGQQELVHTNLRRSRGLLREGESYDVLIFPSRRNED